MEFVQPIRELDKIHHMKRFLAAKPRDLLLFTLGINSALRVSDLLKLRVSDLVDEKGQVREFLEVREKKTGKSKRFPINKSVRKALRQFLDAQRVEQRHYLFRSRKGENQPIHRVQAHRILSGAAGAVGIRERIGTHTLRKTWGYHAYKQGVDPTLLQFMLNHSTPSTTLRYLGITQSDTDSVVMDLNL